MIKISTTEIVSLLIWLWKNGCESQSDGQINTMDGELEIA